MYKKIKNGSFMNWIWFIICTLPIMLLIIYSISFFNREENNYIYTTEIEQIQKIEQQKTSNYPKLIENNLYKAFNWSSNQEIQHNNNIYTIDNNNKDIGIADLNDMSIIRNFCTIGIIETEENNLLDIIVYDENETDLYIIENYNINVGDNIIINNFQKNYIAYNLVFTKTCKISIGFYEQNIASTNQYIEPKCIGTNPYIELESLYYNNNEIELPTNKLYENDYIDFENGIYTQNGIEYPFNTNNEFIELNKNYTLNYNNNSFSYSTYTEETKNINKTNNTNYNIMSLNGNSTFNNYHRLNIIHNTKIINITNYEDYLQSINNTLKSNGFISNAFLNLSSLFGVNNVYYSLACYYIEYLLVIVLLHLAFDVLYMLPNICHKFMEKIGGERD